MPVTEAQVRQALKSVLDPDLHLDIVTLGFVKHVGIEGGHVALRIELTTPACPVKEQLKAQAEEAVRRVPGVTSVAAEMTAVVKGSGRLPVAGDLAPQVKNFIAVGAGKGGVGKSTVAVNLAISLLQSGASVGVMDGDVYGPSVPKMLGNEQRPQALDDKHIRPNEAHGLKLMSMGLILDPDKPVVWRGPIVHTAIRQFLGDVVWGPLDYLVIDLPPGTGDVALTLAQAIPVTGAVVVCTPQDVALLDVRKAVAMFRQLKIPILGLVENMSFYACPSCGKRDDIFGHGGAEAWAREQGIPFLGAIPLHAQVRVGGDAGLPASLDPKAPEAVKAAFRSCASELARQVSILNLSRPIAGALEIAR
ncbi:MAG TPA: Mrp/NBP35 family ATP-binding protein [Planctomycetota bacterium]|nr:Mrp/NBP35 family ATP-binding protein [Planctomycetota bacterium]